MPGCRSVARGLQADAPAARHGRIALATWIAALAIGAAAVAEHVGDLGAAERLVVRGLEEIPAERLRAGLLGDADVYWLGLPTADRDAYLASLRRRATVALETAGFSEPQVSVAVEPRADGVDMVALDVVEGPRFMAGPIEVTGLPADLAARLVRHLQERHPPLDAQPETVVLPDGTTTIQWSEKDGKPAKLVEPVWKPGEPAPHGGSARESVRRQVGGFLRQEGFYELTGAADADRDETLAALREHVDVELLHEGGQATLVIHVKRLPPRSTLAAIEVADGTRVSEADLRAHLGLEIGQPVTDTDRVMWRETIRQSSCFISQDVTFTLEPVGIVARFDLVDYEHARPLDAPRSREEEAMRRFRSRLMGAWHAGREVRFRGTRQAALDGTAPPAELDIVLGRDAGMVIAARIAAARYGCAVVRDGMGFFAPTARLEARLPNGSSPIPSIGLTVAPKEANETAQRMQSLIGVGFTTSRQVVLPVHIEPVWCAAMAHAATSCMEGGEIVLECEPGPDPKDGRKRTGKTVIRLDEAEGRLRCSTFDGWAITIETGDGLVDRTFADLRAASGENLGEATRPVEATGRFLMAALESFPAALEGFVDAEMLEGTAEECQKRVDLVRRVLAGGVSDELDDVLGRLLGDMASEPGPDALPIPDDPEAATAATEQPRGGLAAVLHLCGPDILRWLEARLGRDAWPVAFARVAVLHGCGDEAAFDRELDRLVASGVADESADTIARLLGESEDFVVRLRVFLARRAARREIAAGRNAAAVGIYRDALARLEKTAGPDAPALMPLRIDCGLAFVAAGDAKAAVPVLATVVEKGESTGVDPVRITGLQFFLVLALVSEKQFAEAITCAEAFLARVEAGDADEKARGDVPRMREVIGYCHGQLGDHEKSLAVYRELLAEAEERHGPEHPETAKLLVNTIWLLNQTGDVAEAYRLNRRPRADITRGSIVGLEPPIPASRKQPPVSGGKTQLEKSKTDESSGAVERWSGLDVPLIPLR